MRLFEEIDGQEALLMIETSKKGMHKTLSGKFVKFGSKECREDIEKRIEDVTYHRNESNPRTDERSYQTGLLQVLRRKLRENDRIMLSQQDGQPKRKASKKLIEGLDENAASRILELAGLL